MTISTRLSALFLKSSINFRSIYLPLLLLFFYCSFNLFFYFKNILTSNVQKFEIMENSHGFSFVIDLIYWKEKHKMKYQKHILYWSKVEVVVSSCFSRAWFLTEDGITCGTNFRWGGAFFDLSVFSTLFFKYSRTSFKSSSYCFCRESAKSGNICLNWKITPLLSAGPGKNPRKIEAAEM